MGLLLGLSRCIDAVTAWIGRTVAWLILAAILISAINAVIRKVFGVSSNSWLELQWVLFGAVFLLCASWTLTQNEHIRIDIVSSMFPNGLRSAIELVGHLFFLAPTAAVMTYLSWPFFLRSYEGNEQSMNAGGLVVWPGKLLVFLGFLVLLVQAISEIIKRLAIMAGRIPDPLLATAMHSAAEAEADRLLKTAQEGGVAPIDAPTTPQAR